jgi:hypothetical protein
MFLREEHARENCEHASGENHLSEECAAVHTPPF